VQALAAHQAEERAANEALFTQARQELTYRWQERMTQMQDTLMIKQQQLMARHEEETVDLLVSVLLFCSCTACTASIRLVLWLGALELQQHILQLATLRFSSACILKQYAQAPPA
jgi:hypothetical protein